MGKKQSKELPFSVRAFGTAAHEEHEKFNASRKENGNDYGFFETCLVGDLDRRKPVDPKRLKSLPYSAILRLECRFKEGISDGKFKENMYGGTCCLINPVCALTATHNIYEANRSEWATSIKAISAQVEEDTDVTSSFVCYIYKFDDCDLALLIFEKPFANLADCFGMLSITKAGDLHSEPLRVTGFPMMKDNRYDVMYTHKGSLIKINDEKISYDIDTSSGQSGSPVWIKQSSKYFIVGIHSKSGSHQENATPINHGVLLTKDRIHKINEWMKDISPSEKNQTDDALEYSGNKTSKHIAIQDLKKILQEFFKVEGNKEALIIERDKTQLERITPEILRQGIDIIAKKWNIAEEKLWKKLILDFNGCFLFKDQSLKDLSYHLGESFLTLERLKLDISVCKGITDDGISTLAEQMGKGLDNLQDLNLNLTACTSITDQGVIDLVNQIGRNLIQLKHLRINFSLLKQVKDPSLEAIGSGLLRDQCKFQSLYLNFSACEKITDYGLSCLADKLGEDLLELNLNFTGCRQITNGGIQNLANKLDSRLQRLRSLTLSFAACEKILDEGLEILANRIGNSLINLKQLHLDFTACMQITDDGVKTLLAQIKFNLEGLSLYFSWCKEVTNDTICRIARHIEENRFSHLKSLSLCFSGCMQVVDQGVKDLAQQISDRIQDLKYLNLNFTSCPRITNEAQQSVNYVLEHVETLDTHF